MPSASQPAGPASWTAVTPAGLPQIATLKPTVVAGDSVARTTAFTLTSLTGQPAASLAAQLVVQPAVAFSVRESVGGAILQPTQPLAPATRYRFSIARSDGTVAAAWTALTAGPLHVASSVPGNEATAVPTDTGIEIDFDQSGVTAADLQAHLAITPATPGHIVARGRAMAFVPDRQLKTATLYTVTVRRGLPLGTTGETLANDAVIRFETAAAKSSSVRVWLADALVDASPRERAAMTVWVQTQDDQAAPTSVAVTVHRLAGLDQAIAAWRAVADMPDWTVASAQAAVPTTALPRVASATVAIQHTADETAWIQLPRSLPAGWYVVTVSHGGVPRQLVLQITDTATYALVTTTRTAVWVNDLRSGEAVVGATASLAGTQLAGATDASGLLTTATPAKIAAGGMTAPLLLVRTVGGTTFRPIAGESLCGGCDSKGAPIGQVAPEHWWTLLATDRTEYRQTDTVNVVGVVRQRGSGSVPPSVGLSLLRSQSEIGLPELAVETQTATPDARGMYTASLKIADLPSGGYRIRATAGSEPVGEVWLEVAVIRKPAYTISVTTDRHAVVSGGPVRTSVSVAFFEGTPVAGDAIALRLNGDESPRATATTDTDGRGSAVIRPTVSNGQFQVVQITGNPTQPEEAQLSGLAQVAVFQGNAFISLTGSPSAKTVTVTGAVNTVAWARFEAADDTADLSSIDPRGAPRSGARVQVGLTAHVEELHQTGTEYDFITKRVVPRYEVTDRTIALPAQTVRTGADGTFRFEVPAASKAYGYDLTATYVDEDGHRIVTDGWASAAARYGEIQPAWLQPDAAHAQTPEYKVGETVQLQFTGGVPQASLRRYLYVTLQQGLLTATVSGASSVAVPFTSASLPDISIGAVRFNGAGYDVPRFPYTADMAPSERTMSVSLTPDKPRYDPGASATVSVRTLDRDGRPVAASVFVRAVDEKLYAIGAASDADPVATLYASVSDGLLGSSASHKIPGQDYGGGGGDTTGGGGGGERADFRDWLLARVVQTDASGNGSVTIPLSDDLTTWRVSATAVDRELDAGAATAKLQVGLPFFVDSVLAPEYLAADRPSIRVRAFGTALPPGTKVTFTVSSDTIPMGTTSATADAFGSAYIPLPAFTSGSQKVRIAATATVGGQQLQDALVRTFSVVDRRATQSRTAWSQLTSAARVQAGAASTRLLLVDAGRGRVVPTLESLAQGGAVRSDQELASALANRILTAEFGIPAVTPTEPGGLDPYLVADGVAVVPWGSADLDTTVLGAMTGDPRLTAAAVEPSLAAIAGDPSQTRARRYLALAGLAALGEPVGQQVAEAAALTDLTVEEQVNLAVAALAGGDEALAGRLEQQLLAQHAFRYGNQVRIDPGEGADMTVTTARLGIVAASLGDPVAAEMDDYVAAHPSATTLVDLERVLAARGWASRVASTPASVTLTVDGKAVTVPLASGQAASYELTPEQAKAATVAPATGSVLLVQSWDAPLDGSSLKPPDGVSISRTVTPSGTVPADGTVIVTYHVVMDPVQRGIGWQLVDAVPSGLAPIRYFGTWADAETSRGFASPSSIDGQRVAFVVGFDPRQGTYDLRYIARVVSPGQYAWEPAVMQSLVDPAWGLTVAPTTMTIAVPGS